MSDAKIAARVASIGGERFGRKGLMGIPSTCVSTWEPSVIPLLGMAAERSRGRDTPETYLKMCREQDAQLWVYLSSVRETLQAVLITQIMNHDGGKTLVGLAMAGYRMPEWLHCLPNIEQWGRDRGCVRASWLARPGVERLLKPHGYVKTHVLLERDL